MAHPVRSDRQWLSPLRLGSPMQSRLGTGLAATWGLLYLVPWAVKLPGNARHPPLPPSPSQPACSASLSLKVKLHRATPRTKTNALPSVFLHASPSLCSRTCEARPSPVFVQRAQRCRFSTILTLIRRPSRSVLARRLAVCSVVRGDGRHPAPLSDPNSDPTCPSSPSSPQLPQALDTTSRCLPARQEIYLHFRRRMNKPQLT